MTGGCLHDASFLRPAGATSTDQDTADLIMVCGICDALAEAKMNFRADLLVVKRALADFLGSFGNAMAPLGRAERDLDTQIAAILDDGDADGEMLRTTCKSFVEAWQATCAPVYEAQGVLDAALSSVFASLPRGES